VHWLRVTTTPIVPLSTTERQSAWVLGVVNQGNLGSDPLRGEVIVAEISLVKVGEILTSKITCKNHVLGALARTEAVPEGL
jgi:hypothetical protein